MMVNLNSSVAFEHWQGAMARTFAQVPLVFEATCRGRVSVLGGWFREPIAAAVNDNQPEGK